MLETPSSAARVHASSPPGCSRLKFRSPSLGELGTPFIISETHVADRVSGPVRKCSVAPLSLLSFNNGIFSSSSIQFSPTPSKIIKINPSPRGSWIAGGWISIPSGVSESSNTCGAVTKRGMMSIRVRNVKGLVRIKSATWSDLAVLTNKPE